MLWSNRRKSMIKNTINYVCNNCGGEANSWSGKCPHCQEWNTLVQQFNDQSAAAYDKFGHNLKISTITESIKTDQKRISCGTAEIDQVLGGGVVAGSINLIAGQPGIGKSTLLLQIAYNAAKHISVLYVSGEESAHQIGMRASRLGVGRSELQLATSDSADDIAQTIVSSKFKLVIVDSIQTISTASISSAAGSISQITSSTQLITTAAKSSNCAVILVGHVTKEGVIAGPKILEHVVDVVLNLEGDRYGGFKVLRAVKNRFGSTLETAIFEMTELGLKVVDNPSAALLAERRISDGSIVLATLEGTRPLLVEVQALVNPTSYGYPKRAASGFDLNRLNLLLAMMEKRTRLSVAQQDVYINIVGGMQIKEPAADLAICMAIGSASKGLQLKKEAVVFGEVGLSGEIRHVPYLDKRIAEAKKLGFLGAIGPIQKNNKRNSNLYGVTDVRSALNQFLEKD